MAHLGIVAITSLETRMMKDEDIDGVLVDTPEHVVVTVGIIKML